MTPFVLRALRIAGLTLMASLPSKSFAATVDEQAWTAYKGAFLESTGRIVDTGNGNISHSEGQGYGMWLAVLAGNPADFELIWSFTKTELLVRNDGLAAWKWDPQANPHITDINNATDGDILIAYALALAAAEFNRPDYQQTARAIINTIAEKAVIQNAGRTLLLPAVEGFSATDRNDGPVINPSYLIFEAFPVFDMLSPSPVWQALTRDGVALLESFSFGDRKLPADWVSMKRRPQPAEGFAPEFGYNAVRIPLYLAQAKAGNTTLYTRLLTGMSVDNGSIATVDLRQNTVKDTLSDPGYRMVAAITACAANGTRIPDDLRSFSPTLYYPSTLHLLALSAVAQTHRECL
ncbi:glycosyl hydrolase family 8 [Agrobacterium sp.]|jgi:endoglucanase|uniref:glycosyl hydrolase family 8 n=1 Tax=Agrobacterium sp. TaxID=361 RepID=UPI0028B08995|nr:glycosyl hydrolase family 8 [Agrobacterium sp.]